MNTPPAKAGGFGLWLKAGLIHHAADLHLISALLYKLLGSSGISHQLFKPTHLSIDNTEIIKKSKTYPPPKGEGFTDPLTWTPPVCQVHFGKENRLQSYIRPVDGD